MATITTRAGKGSPLTNTEVDNNFTNLNTDKAEVGANSDITSLSGITGDIGTPDSITFDTTATETRAVAKVWWNDTDGCLNVGLKGSDVTLQVGQEELLYVYNNEDSGSIANGELVYAQSVSNGNIAVKKFIADGTIEPDLVLGVATETIANASLGYVTTRGLVRGLDTSTYSGNERLFASASTAGALTATAPASPNRQVHVGIVADVNATEGTIFVNAHAIPDASEIFYDNSDSDGLTSTNVKAALDELNVNKADVSLLSSNVTLFPTSAASADIGGYGLLVQSTSDPDYDSPAADVSTGALSTTLSLVGSLATAASTEVFIGDISGISVTVVGNIKRTAGNDSARFKFEVYKRASGGTETKIGESGLTDYTGATTYTQFFETAYISSATFTATDRVVLKFYAQSDAGTPTFSFQYGGTEPVRGLFPVPVTVVPTDNDAVNIQTSTTSFGGILSGSDTTVQAALDTIDDHGHGISDVSGLQSALDAKLASSSYTAADVLTKIKTVDGTGSGLDADTLDGNEATAFATAAQGTLADGALQASNNLSDVGTAATALSNIGGQPLDAGLTSISGLTTAANKMIYTSASDTYAVTDLSAYGRSLIDDADAAAARTTLGLGTAATTASTAYATAAQGALADSAVQPSDNISGLTNDSGYLTGNQTITLSGDASGSGTTSISVTVADNSHNHTFSNISDGTEAVQDVVGGMVSTNTENGIAVTYDDINGKLNFDVADPTIELVGAVTGSATMTNLGNVTITTAATSDPTITLAGDLTGSATLTNLGNATLTASLASTYDNYGGWTLYTDGTSRGNIASSENVNFIGGTNVSLSYSATNNSITFASTDTTYSAGSGLDISGTTFSIEPDLRDGITHVGLDSGDYIGFTNNAQIDFYVNGGNRVRIEADGDLHADGDVIAYSTTISDERLKYDIRKIEDALTKVDKINGVTFIRKHNDELAAGVIAQEIMEVLPEAVREKSLPLQTGTDETYYVVEYDAITGLLIEAIKELKARVEKLEG